jgi:hypothetical protein
MAQFTVSVHFLPSYGSGKLIIERERIELAPGFFGLSGTSKEGLTHASKVIHFVRLRIAWPWTMNRLVIASEDAIAVAILLPFQRSKVLAEVEGAGFVLEEHSVWSYSKKSLAKLISQE